MIRDVIVKDASNKGLGVFALKNFAKGEFIFRRRYGKVVAKRDIARLSKEDQRHLCELDWETSALLLPPGCYLNHACDPNAMRKGVNVYAWKDIRQGEEITIDYRLNAFDGGRYECFCGSTNCPGYMTNSFFAMSEEQQHLYLPYAPKFIREEHHRATDHLSHRDDQCA
jgi:SET domain-containing protein